MEVLKKRRAACKGTLTRFIKYLESSTETINHEILKARLDSFEGLEKKFDDIHTEMEALDTNSSIGLQDTREEFEDNYFAAIAKAKILLASVQAPPLSENLTAGSSNKLPSKGVHLPKISLPTFDGSYGAWLRYRDTFLSLIHENNALNPIQKFHYLNSSLTGNALRSIETLGISDANYAIAWETLCSRYEDEGALIYHHTQGLFDLPAIIHDSHTELQQLLDGVRNHLLALQALGESVEHWGTLVIHILTSKLNASIKREWERERTRLPAKPALKDMYSFMEKHCRFLHKVQVDKVIPGDNRTKNKIGFKSASSRSIETVNSYAVATKACSLCKGAHPLYACASFKQLSPLIRRQKVQELQLCYNCLSAGHRNRQCSLTSCKICGKKHNTLLHIEQPPQHIKTDKNEKNDASTSKITESVITAHARKQTRVGAYVLLATARVLLQGKNGSWHECRALLDSCSQPHIITSEMCRRLGLDRTRAPTAITGIEQGCRDVTHQITIKFRSRFNNFSTTITCLILDKITDNLPCPQMEAVNIETPKGIELADPDYRNSQSIDLLIGAGLFYQLMCVGQIKLQNRQLIFQKTLLGWIVTGSMNLISFSHSRVNCNIVRGDELSRQLEKFWEIEGCHAKGDRYQGRLEYAEQQFRETTERDFDGRFIVSIPFKSEISLLGSSLEMALKRLYSTESKLAKNEELRTEYVNFLKEYEDLGHMTEIFEKDEEVQNFYLPHHAVIKEGSSTTKLRVVFDGSAKTSSGLSLNDVQHIGYPVQEDLFAILVRFRQHSFVISADIAKMYRQIRVKHEERKMQRILWRSRPSLPIRIFELNTVTYGTGSAAFLATRCLEEIGVGCRETNPIASQAIRHDFYVDDLLTGAKTIPAAIKLREELRELLGARGMELRKWASNDSRILKADRDISLEDVCIRAGEAKTLGLVWNSAADLLKYKVTIKETHRVTKRSILSTIAQIFDPLGILGPAIIQAKIIMQRLWQLKLEWDESLPQDLHDAWTHMQSQLIFINKYTVNRRVVPIEYQKIEYHGFCDASEYAYGACVYVCTTDKNGKRTAQLLCAKSRVAPLKAITIPRLELLGALLLAQLSQRVASASGSDKKQWHFWSDSMVVLSWLRAPANRWKTFIANRVAEIQEITNERWNHVESERNPADLISRGVSSMELFDSSLWWKGPQWLLQEESKWPRSQLISSENIEERKLKPIVLQEVCCATTNVKHPTTREVFNNLLQKYSSFSRLIRITAYLLRFSENCRDKLKKYKGLSSSTQLANVFLRSAELRRALHILLKNAQAETFWSEIQCLQERRDIAKSSRLYPLRPFLDNMGIIRLGGRISNANISYEQQHPIVLPPKHQFTRLLITHEHARMLHAGCQAVIASLRERYWVISARSSVRSIIKKCIKCFKERPFGTTYIMGDLPAVRVTPGRPFINCGVDYAGPFLIKEKLRSKTSLKAYICVFVCFFTKAIHIELASDLSTNAFLNCFKRFISRRGKCKRIYSDNGTNFVGARNELLELQELLRNKQYQDTFTNFSNQQFIDWHFIPPSAPHFGGLWEGAVKSLKYHLRRVMGDTRLTYEELLTLLTQVDACLNSRPLTPLSNDPEDLTPLTPAHFLIGDSLTALPQDNLHDIKANRLKRFQHLQQMLQHFWRRWQQEYLPSCQLRRKWSAHGSTHTVKINDMVLIKDDNLPPLQWSLGRIIETHPGKDGVIRVVSVKTIRGIIKRPVIKICILPIDESTDEDSD